MDVAAGAIGILGVAQQLAQSVYQIKCFCKEVEQAPVELLQTIESLGNTSSILMQLAEADQKEQLGNGLLLRQHVFHGSLELCKKAVDGIAAMAMELQRGMQRSRLRSSIRTVLKKPDFQSMLQRLDRSKVDLHIAYSMYMDARRRVEHEALCRRFDQALLNTTVHPLSQSDATEDIRDAKENCYDLVTRKRKPSKAMASSVEFRIRLPLWLYQRAWDLAFERASGCWTASLKTFRVIDVETQYIVICEPYRVPDMLQNRELSVHDQDEYGATLFQIAARWGHTALARYLLVSGADPYWMPRPEGPRLSIPEGPFYTPGGWDKEAVEHARAHAQVLSEIDDDVWPEAGALVETLIKAPACWTPEERLTTLATYERSCDPTNFLKHIGGDNIDPKLFHVTTSAGISLVHVIARQFSTAEHDRRCGGRRAETSWPIWINLFAQAVRANADLHALIEYSYKTPFQLILSFWPSRRRVDRLSIELQSWADCLAQAGVDLQRYGEAEHEHWRQNPLGSEQYLGFEQCFGFMYGSKPSDWHLWLRHPGDVFAGLFWDMVEHPERAVPGSWNELDEELVQNHDEWGYADHYRLGGLAGVKRRVLRLLKSQVRTAVRTHVVPPCDAALVKELCDAVQCDAENNKRDKSTRGSSYRVQGLTEILEVARWVL